MADNESNGIELYPGNQFFSDVRVGLLKIYSITFGVEITFLPYDLRITENLTPEWNQESVIGRMDPIARFKRMGRTMNINFKARAKEKIDMNGTEAGPYLPYDDLLHCVDHLKRVSYPRYDGSQVMTSPPLFRIKHDLILAGENTQPNGVLCYFTSLKADPVMEKNSVFYKIGGEQSEKLGNLNLGIYPKIFDINIGLTVLNEQLSRQTIGKTGIGILKKRYFYNYNTTHGPDGGHPGGSSAGSTRDSGSGDGRAGSGGTNPARDAATANVTGGDK
jgi:hypothetical protein